MTPNRRDTLMLAALMAASSALPATADETPAQHMHRMNDIPENAPKAAILVHPKMVMLDLVGPMTVLRILRMNVQLVWKDMNPCSTDLFPVTPTQTFDKCPKDLDVLMVPGGILGTVDCMNDPEVMTFLADRGARAKWVCSVCTGGLTLAAAGLLNGYNATAHWAVADLLPLMGATHVDERVVTDRNRMTGGGVTAGIDMALTLARHLADEETARRVALTIEYAPHPPFQNGTPSEAGPERTAEARNRRKWMDGQAKAAAEAAGVRLGTL